MAVDKHASPRCLFSAGTAFWHVFAEISTGLKNVLWYVRRLKHNFKVDLCSDPNIDVASQKMASTNLRNVLIRSVGFYSNNFQPTHGVACLDHLISNLCNHNINISILDFFRP